ncbi:3-oxoacyl-[acyl-carrier protein] reductase [Paenibacillus sp. V4I3]|uniref:SDR family NAD(P)-dependent oxidoreductase n=1 Tax=unclassified Paenibacillus TaxID=185978 RepID=UPI002788EEE9|nr:MULTISPECIES: glucose 1-dehydrogenase [unclassified Paenibacillus]MDQ0875254.1 3-oxoacyl-[acyl-carrier protein] reductase [Paenibacillus sp. V4I3]MDQ0889014.1 3-oxoacyl-[acyl-carrier protein] reductase [Paenibacillus sp. V4I9]
MSRMRLERKVAVITGAASGIGEAVARRFAEEGACVIVNDISEEGVRVVEEIVEAGGNALFVHADIRAENSVIALMEAAKTYFGALHILVNNAGVTCSANVVTADEAAWDHVMNLNLKSAWYCCKHAIPFMMEQGGGSIVNIGSTHVIRTQRNHFPYHSSKAGMLAMAQGICVDFGGQGIRANTISPGFIETPLAETYMQSYPNREQKRNAMLATHPVGRFGKPEDVANAAVFLASDEAGFIAGANLVVDGGRSVLQVFD